MSAVAHPLAAPARLARAATRFEIPALLRLLRRAGYGPEAVMFESALDAPGAPGGVDAIRLDGSPPRAVVRLHGGLLGPDAPLPSYFQRFAGEVEDARPLLAFLGFFDHVLARTACELGYPADGVARGSALPAAYQAIAGARSPARLHALVRMIVPELPVEVFAATLERGEANDAACLGSARLDGTSLLGFRQEIRAAGFIVRLHAETERDDGGRPWVDVVRERCGRSLVPLLRRGARAVSIRLRLGSYAGRVLVGRSELGREPMTDGVPRGWEVEVLRVGARGRP